MSRGAGFKGKGLPEVSSRSEGAGEGEFDCEAFDWRSVYGVSRYGLDLKRRRGLSACVEQEDHYVVDSNLTHPIDSDLQVQGAATVG